MYKDEFPSKHNLVMGKVLRFEESQAYVSLLEYDNIEAMILYSDVSRKKKYNIKDHLREGMTYVFMVSNVDESKKYVDLNKKNVTIQDIEEHTNFYAKSKKVHRAVRSACEKDADYDMLYIYQNYVWPLYDTYDHAYDAFDSIDNLYIPDEDKLLRDILALVLSEQKDNTPVNLTKEIEVTCNTSEGIESIKAALKAGERESISITLVAPPIYRLSIIGETESDVNKAMALAVDEITKTIVSKGGICVCK